MPSTGAKTAHADTQAIVVPHLFFTLNTETFSTLDSFDVSIRRNHAAYAGGKAIAFPDMLKLHLIL